MGTQGKPSSDANSTQRVKVYHLNDDGKWDDRGTGHVSVDYLERSEDLRLFVIDEEDNETLLVHRIRSDEIYRRQEDTIISWRDPEYSTELALSFQETTGCSYIWDHICSVRRNLHFNTLSDIEIGPQSMTETLETSVTSQADEDTFHSVNSDLRELPMVELSTLPLILKIVVESSIADQMRVTELLLRHNDFFLKLMDLFRICEDMENFDGLHMMFKLVKGIFLLNNPRIFEKILGNEMIMDIIGSLEYDPEVPHVQHHRAFLKEHVVYKEAIPIKDPIVLSKIHQTYRVGYIKDVILPRVLDEVTIAHLNSIIHANNAVVVSSLKDDSTFIQELFARLRLATTSIESKKDLVFFLHEFCNLSKSLQVVHQMRLFRDLINEGIFDIIIDVLQSQDKRLIITGTDILILFLNQDPNLLRTYVIRQEGNLLLGLLVKGLITDFGEDMHCQFLEILRCLLDSYTPGSQRDTIIEMFYEKHLDRLIDVITLSCPPKGVTQSAGKSTGFHGKVENSVTKPEILSSICELLCFCVLHHPYRIKCNFLLNNVIEKVLLLTHRREKYLVVAAIRFVRTIISHKDDQLLRHIVENNLLKPVVEAFVSNGNRYNLLNSAVLELFEFLRKENLKHLIVYIVDSFWNELTKFEYATIHALKVKCEQYLDNHETRNISSVDTRKRPDERALEKEEEDYFNEDSDEEDTASANALHTHNQQAQRALSNGVTSSYTSLRSKSGGLVDYDDDDEDYDEHSPLSRSKLDSDVMDDSTVNSPSSKRQSTSNKEKPEPTKKQKLDKSLSCNTISISTTFSTCTHVESQRKNVIIPTSSAPQNPDGNCNSDEESVSERRPAVRRSCSNCLSKTSDIRQSSGEDSSLMPLSGNNSSAEIPVNGANIGGSEPYSVR